MLDILGVILFVVCIVTVQEFFLWCHRYAHVSRFAAVVEKVRQALAYE